MNLPNMSSDLESVLMSVEDFIISKPLIDGYFLSLPKHLPSDNKPFKQRVTKKNEILNSLEVK